MELTKDEIMELIYFHEGLAMDCQNNYDRVLSAGSDSPDLIDEDLFEIQLTRIAEKGIEHQVRVGELKKLLDEME